MVIAGQTYCFTGTMKKSRRQIERLTRERGGKVSHKVTSGCVLVAGRDAVEGRSSKLVEAQLRGIEIIAAEEFFK